MSNLHDLKKQFLKQSIHKDHIDDDVHIIELSQKAKDAGFSECLVLTPHEMCATIYNPKRLKVHLSDMGDNYQIANLSIG